MGCARDPARCARAMHRASDAPTTSRILRRRFSITAAADAQALATYTSTEAASLPIGAAAPPATLAHAGPPRLLRRAGVADAATRKRRRGQNHSG